MCQSDQHRPHGDGADGGVPMLRLPWNARANRVQDLRGEGKAALFTDYSSECCFGGSRCVMRFASGASAGPTGIRGSPSWFIGCAL